MAQTAFLHQKDLGPTLPNVRLMRRGWLMFERLFLGSGHVGHPGVHPAAAGAAPLPPPDHWLNVMMGLGAVAAVLGLMGAVYVAGRYGRRASVSLAEAKAYEVPAGTLVVARPSIRSVGVFRIRFLKQLGSVVTAYETGVNEDGSLPRGHQRSQTDLFGDSFVEGSEELVTTATLLLPEPSPSVVGWTVYLEIRARHRFLYFIFKMIPKVRDRGYLWTDQVFIPRSSVTREA